MSEKGTILSYVGDIPIRKNNHVRINFNAIQYRRLALASQQTGLSIPDILAFMNQPCPVCKNDSITVTIPHNILSPKNKSGTSFNIDLSDDKQNKGS